MNGDREGKERMRWYTMERKMRNENDGVTLLSKRGSFHFESDEEFAKLFVRLEMYTKLLYIYCIMYLMKHYMKHKLYMKHFEVLLIFE